MNYASLQIAQRAVQVGHACSSNVSHPQLSRAVGMMENSLDAPLSISDVAGQLAISQRQLERLFSRYIGVPPMKYYMNLRLSRAFRLLTQTHNTVTFTALECGFSSPGYFAKCFRQKFKISPHNLRRGGLQPAFPTTQGLT